jgi:hypothetical protein
VQVCSWQWEGVGCRTPGEYPPPPHGTLFMPRDYLDEMVSAGGARTAFRAKKVRDFGSSRPQGRREGNKERGVPFFIFQRPLVVSGSDSSALPLGCSPGFSAPFSLAWRNYPLECASSYPPFLFTSISLVQTPCFFRALSPLPVTLFYFRSFPVLPHPHATSFPSAASRFSPGAETPPRPITEGPSANRGRASVSCKGDAGPISPRVRRGALLALAGALRYGHALPGGSGVVVFPPPTRNAIHGVGVDVMRGAQWALSRSS